MVWLQDKQVELDNNGHLFTTERGHIAPLNEDSREFLDNGLEIVLAIFRGKYQESNVILKMNMFIIERQEARETKHIEMS